MIDLSIILVSWNSRRDLERCIPSVAPATVAHTYEVLVIDNNSSDGTLAYVRSVVPDSICQANAENRGFAAANNQGIALAQGRYVLLLNPDTLLHKEACDRLVQFMDLNPDVFACGPALLNGDGSPQRTGVRFPSLWNLSVETVFLDRLLPRSRLFGRHRELYADPTVPRPVDFVQGSCLLVRREAIERVGVLDEAFFMYFEETDWCKRMRELGGEVWYVPSAEVVHFGGGAFGHYDEKRLIAYHQSLLLYFRKHGSSWERIALRCVVVVRTVVRLLVWSLMAVSARGERHAQALSALRGYARIVPMLFHAKAMP